MRQIGDWRVWVNWIATALQRLAGSQPQSSGLDLGALARIAEVTSNHILVTDPQFRTIWINPAFAEGTGFTLPEVIGKTPFEYMNGKNTLADVASEVRARAAQGLGYRYVSLRYSKSGERFWVDVDMQPVKDSDGATTHIVFVARDITKERLLTEDRQRLSSLVEHSNNIAVLVDGAGRVIYVNAAFERVTGYTLEDVRGRRPGEILDGPETDAAVSQHVLASIAAKQPVQAEKLVYTKTGGRRWVLWDIQPVFNAAGDFNCFTSVGVDLTAQRTLEMELKARVQEVQSLAQVAQMTRNHVIITGVDRRITWANQAACDVVGQPLSALIGKTVPEVFHSEASVADGGAAAIEDVMRGQTVRIDHGRRRHDGERLWVSEEVSSLRDVDGAIVGIVSVAVDLTQQRGMEDAVRRSEQLLADMAEIGEIGGWELDLDTMKPRWTAQTKRLHEVDADYEPTLEGAIGFYSPEAQPVVRAVIDDALRTGSRFDFELPLITAKGRQIWVKCNGRIDVVNGKPQRLIGAVQDVTERRKQEALIENHSRELERFAHVASHDLQDPLRKIATHGRLLLEALNKDDTAEARRCAGVITTAAERGRSMVSALLRYAKLREKPVERAPVPLQNLVGDVVSELREGTDPGASLRHDIEPVEVICDEHLIQQVLQNVIGNAIKYTKPDEPADVRITSRREAATGHIVLSVIDRGIGFDMAFRDAIFEPFKRLVAYGSYAGTGVGLSLVKSILDKHGWRIEVASHPGQGTTFDIHIPASDILDPPGSLMSARERWPAAS